LLPGHGAGRDAARKERLVSTASPGSGPAGLSETAVKDRRQLLTLLQQLNHIGQHHASYK